MSQVAARTLPKTQPLQVAWDLVLILLLAVLVRLATFNGAFGSDDLTYFGRAAELARGEWTSANYNGALRYGFNIPAAGFMALFGPSLFVANLWPLSCSLIEIGAVFMFANAAMNRRAGIYSALLLATAPLHIAVATRIHADPVVSMFITISFVLIYFGVLGRKPLLLFAAGLSIGGIYWSKELAAVTWLAFLPLLWLFRTQWRSFIYVVAGTLLAMLLHGMLMLYIAGDPLHLVKVVLGAMKRNFVDAGQGEDGAAYYLRYLFIDVRHVGAIAFLAAASLVLLPRWIAKEAQAPVRTHFIFVLLWWVGLLAVLSLFPVSLSPLRLTMKQSNYITLFLAPTAILAGMSVATFPRLFGRWVLVLCMLIGLLLGAFQQADYRAFTANSKALATFAEQHPRAVFIGSTNNSSLGSLLVHLSGHDAPMAKIISFNEMANHPDQLAQIQNDADEVFAVIDKQTMSWYQGKTPVTAPLSCWQHELTLTPMGLGLGNELAKQISAALWFVSPVANALQRLAIPQAANVYRVSTRDVFCRKS